MDKPSVILIYVQHLRGVGHVFRALRVAQALHRSGCFVKVIWGGEKIPHVNTEGLDISYLDPVHIKNENFHRLFGSDGQEFTDQQKENRKKEVLKIYTQWDPDVVITETFPFGRRQMRFELHPLIEQIQKHKKKPLLIASIRDIIQENRSEKSALESVDTFNKYYDALFVHGDPRLIKIEDTLQFTSLIKKEILYTGIVAPTLPSLSKEKKYSVVISAGSGVLGEKLIETTFSAKRRVKNHNKDWLVSIGNRVTDEKWADYKQRAPQGVKVFKFIPNFVNTLAQSDLSVSLAGYNTVADILLAQCRPIIIPFVNGVDTEQLRRAQNLSKIGYAQMITLDKLTPENLANSIDNTDLNTKNLKLDYLGAQNTAKLILSLLKQ